MTSADWATIVYSYVFVLIAAGSGLLWLGRKSVNTLTENIIGEIMVKLEPILKIEGDVQLLSARMDAFETHQKEMFALLMVALKLKPKGRATNGRAKKTTSSR
jgi:hypothetical protein